MEYIVSRAHHQEVPFMIERSFNLLGNFLKNYHRINGFGMVYYIHILVVLVIIRLLLYQSDQPKSRFIVPVQPMSRAST